MAATHSRKGSGTSRNAFAHSSRAMTIPSEATVHLSKGVSHGRAEMSVHEKRLPGRQRELRVCRGRVSTRRRQVSIGRTRLPFRRRRLSICRGEIQDFGGNHESVEGKYETVEGNCRLVGGDCLFTKGKCQDVGSKHQSVERDWRSGGGDCQDAEGACPTFCVWGHTLSSVGGWYGRQRKS